MNAQTIASVEAPAIGTPAHRPGAQEVAYVVDVQPNEADTFTIGAGMARNRFSITLASPSGSLSEGLSEHIAAPMIKRAQGYGWPPVGPSEAAQMLQDAREKQEADRDAALRQRVKDDAARDAASERLATLKPDWARAALVAVCEHDDCDSMADYFNVTTSRRIVIGWSKHTRDLFPEMRKAAASFAETAALATAGSDAEHREKYAMGAGYYLKQGNRYSSGWKVEKLTIGNLGSFGPPIEFADHIANPQQGNEIATNPAEGMKEGAGRFTLSQHTHTKKHFQMWIASLSDRVDRAEFNRLRDAAKPLGGWYSRPWAGTPGGFAFKDEAKAREFIAAEGGSPDGSPSPEQGNENTGSRAEGMASAKGAQRAPGTTAAKLRTLAEGMEKGIADCFADRLTNTPKRMRQAQEKRNEGAVLQRAQAIGRALADAHETDAVPPALASVSTKKALLELAAEATDYSGGCYDAGIQQGRPYDWAAVGKPEKAEAAAAAWALIARGNDDAPREDETLARKIEALQFADIPGYFPTPAALVSRMIEAADLPDGARVLEPSAGSGAIADALRDAGHSVLCVEIWGTLADILERKGHRVIAGGFLDPETFGSSDKDFDAVLMNPPFENGKDCDHVRFAYDLLRPGGVLVAIMGAGVTFRQNGKHAECRAFIEERGGEMVELPAGTFKESGTGVSSVMVTLHKS